MEYSRTEYGGIKLTQVAYAEALKPLVINDVGAVTPQSLTKPLDAANTIKLRGGIGAVLFLCLTRWDLLFDLVLLQTQVTTATGQTLKDCNAIVMRAKRHKTQGLIFQPLPGKFRKLAAVADSSHASKKSSYAFEGNLVLLQSENDAQPQRSGDYHTVAASNVPGI